MTPREHQALGIELAVWEAAQAWRLATFRESPAGPLIDSATSPFVNVCWALWELGCAKTLAADGGPPRGDHGAPPPHFLIAREQEVRATLAEQTIMPAQFSSLLGTFIRLQPQVPEAYQLTADWFEATLPAALHDALTGAQFLYCEQGRCRWTGLMAHWTEGAAPLDHWETDEQSRGRRLRTYGPIWESIPTPLKFELIRDGKPNWLNLSSAIGRFWHDDHWSMQEHPDWNGIERGIKARLVADNILRLLEEGELRMERVSTFLRWAWEQ